MKFTYNLLCCLLLSLNLVAQSETEVQSLFTQQKWELYAEKNANLIRKCVQNGKLKEAQRLLQQATQIPTNVLETNAVLKAELLHSQGELALYEGNLDKALQHFENVQSIVTQTPKITVYKQIQYTKNLSLAHAQSGNRENARLLAQQVITLAKNIGEDSEELADAYNNLGLILTTDQPNEAEVYYQKSIDVYQQRYEKEKTSTLLEKIAYSKINLGIIARTQKLYVIAEKNFKEALQLFESEQNDLAKAFVLNNLGQTAFLQNYFESAEQYERQALQIYRQNYGTRHPEIATVLNQLGVIYDAKTKFTTALHYFQEALVANSQQFASQKVQDNPKVNDYLNADIMLLTLSLKAQSLERKYNEKNLKLAELKTAIQTLLVADELIEKIRNLRTSEEDKLNLGKRSTEVYEMGLRMAFKISEFPLDKQFYKEKAFYFAERNKSAVLLAAIADTKAKHFAGIPDSLLAYEQELQAQTAYLEEQLAKTTQDSVKLFLRSDLLSLQKQKNSFNKTLETTYPQYFALKYSQQLADLPRIQQKLDEKTTLVLYAQNSYSKEIYAFFISKHEFDIKISSAKDLESNLIYFRNSIEFQSFEDFVRSANLLSKQLMLQDIPKTTSKLVVIPDGNMGKIPFEALLITEPTQQVIENEEYQKLDFVIQKYSVSYGYSATLFLEEAIAKKTKTNEILLFAPVRFTQMGLADLEGTKTEVEQIYQAFKQKNNPATLVLEEKAKKSVLFDEKLMDYRFIHLATHGKVNEDNPDLSQLFVMNTNGDTESLYTSEIYGIRLNADLVMMSACETGLGKTSKGEGIVGLSRAWLYAGADNLVVSLWQVSDEATSVLATNFYANTLEKSTTKEAMHVQFAGSLRNAKLALLKNEDYAAPYFWASFILIGE